MFWPFLGLIVPTMTSGSKNQYRQFRFRVQLLQCDAIYIWSKVFFVLGKQTILAPRNFLEQKQRHQTSSHTFLDKRFLERIPSSSSSASADASSKIFLGLGPPP
jgi:hypothetical protein